MMQIWSDFGKWIINAILKPVFGTWWAEITAIIVCVLLAAAAFTIGYFYRKLFKKYNTECKCKEELIDGNKNLLDENTKLKQDLKATQLKLEIEETTVKKLKDELSQKDLELDQLKKTDVKIENETVAEIEENKPIVEVESTKQAKKTSKNSKKRK